MLILGIESSCDETAFSLVERHGAEGRVLTEEIKSQIDLHARFGGVVPEIASRSHFEALDLLEQSLQEHGAHPLQDIDLIAVTRGPGLIGSLLIGLSYAKGLAFALRRPLVGVDHVEAHIAAAFIEHPPLTEPYLSLVISGGHTALFLHPEGGGIRLLARTRDDAVGEAFDKAARFFGLPYPGGPILDTLWPEGDLNRFSFTVPRIRDNSPDLSFSGYKTGLMQVARREGITREHPAFHDLVASYMCSVVDYLASHVSRHLEETGARGLVVAGGVSRNRLLRERFLNRFPALGVETVFPAPRYCTDNAAMVAWRGYECFERQGPEPQPLTLGPYTRYGEEV